MFLMNQWYAAALPRELTEKPIGRTICGQAKGDRLPPPAEIIMANPIAAISEAIPTINQFTSASRPINNPCSWRMLES